MRTSLFNRTMGAMQDVKFLFREDSGFLIQTLFLGPSDKSHDLSNPGYGLPCV